VSIYEAMIEHINKYGITKINVWPNENNQCCMLGVLSIVTGSEDPYEIKANVDELVDLSSKGLLEEFGPDSILTGPHRADATYIHSYNDAIIKGDKEKAIAILEEAEEMRKAKG
jgi:hypothetical protein